MSVFEVEPDHELVVSANLEIFSSQNNDQLEEDDIPQIDEYNVHQHVVSFIQHFHVELIRSNVTEIQQHYENNFSRLTERHFKGTTWPHASEIAELVNNDPVFLLLYNELYFRHVYSKLSPTLAHRIASWNNYKALFLAFAGKDVLGAASGNENGGQIDLASLELPYQWLWDMVDEFIYQFQSFCQYRAKTKGKTPEDIAFLKENEDKWDVLDVLRCLQGVAKFSNINQTLDEERKSPTLETKKPTIKMLGYFCLIGMLRVHCLLGDYHTGLKELEHFDFQKKAPLFTRVAACHITIYYYMGFAYMMLRRYADAIKCFAHILIYIHRTKQYQNRTYQFDQISKKNEQMYALLAICIGLCPQRLDETIHSTLKEKFGDRLSKLSRGEDTAAVFEELFVFACPKFVIVSPPNYEGGGNVADAHKLQLHLFLGDVQQQEKHPYIRSYLKLYTTIGIPKLAAFVKMDESTLRQLLLCLKHKTRSKVRNLSDSPLSGTNSLNTDVDFSFEGNMIHVADAKAAVPYGEFFIRHITKFEEIISDLQH